MEYVTLVDDADREQGVMEKLQAHKEGRLHRAISVFIFNSKNELLLQRRAAGKYHSPLLWTNTCCSHPQPGESVEEAASRRLFEEMGIRCSLTKLLSFKYEFHFENGLTEHEIDHVFTGISDDLPTPDPGEVAQWAYFNKIAVGFETKSSPDKFTEWFKICINNWIDEIFPPEIKK